MRPTPAWSGLLSLSAGPAQRGIGKLIERVSGSRAKASKSLLRVIEDQINLHRQTLARHLRVSSTDIDDCETQIWSRLASYTSDTIEQDLEILKARDVLLSNAIKVNLNPTKRQQFIKELYPSASTPINLGRTRPRRVIDWTSRLTKYGKVDHQRLYHAYRDLGELPLLQLSNADLEKLLQEFLFGLRSFKKPNAILTSFVRDKSKPLVARAFHEMIGSRKSHLNMVMRITNDMKDAGIQLLNKERCAVLYMTLYRDNHTIVNSIEGAHASYGDLLIESYNMIIDKFGETSRTSTDMLNTLLFHAISRDSHEIIRDILYKFGLDGDAGGIKRPNLETFKLLIGYFGKKKMKNSLFHVMDIISSGKYILDISVINKCISALVTCGEIEDAEMALSQMFPQAITSLAMDQVARNQSETIMYKQLSFQDRRLYKALFQIYLNLGEILGVSEPFAIHPTINTFKPLIRHYCENPAQKGSLHKLHRLLTIMTDTYKLPIDTHTYQAAFSWHVRSESAPSSLEWEVLLLLTSRLIIDHDNLYNITQDTSYLEMARLGTDTNVAESLQHFLNTNAASHSTPVKAPTWTGNFVKLSDSMMESIYDAYITALNRIIHGPPSEGAFVLIETACTLKDAITKQRKELQAQLDKVSRRPYRYKARRNDLYQLDEHVLMKKEYLLLLVDIADTPNVP